MKTWECCTISLYISFNDEENEKKYISEMEINASNYMTHRKLESLEIIPYHLKDDGLQQKKIILSCLTSSSLIQYIFPFLVSIERWKWFHNEQGGGIDMVWWITLSLFHKR